ncbi:hypothetical protein E4U41_001340 [Claviceps citrina]|nr:hypothetical protein E4U41_001340 [Claviceps citrina]
MSQQCHRSSNHSRRKTAKVPDWANFYKNGLPKEVIVIEDSSDDSDAALPASLATPTTASSDPLFCNKKRKASYQHSHYSTSTKRSTLPQSSGTQADQNDSGYVSQAKRRRLQPGSRNESNSIRRGKSIPSPSFENYIPPSGPCRKINFAAIRQVCTHSNGSSPASADDEDGHLIVVPGQVIANQYRIDRLLGQGTFGKVVRAYDLLRREHVAVKVIRSIQKYRDAARIEARVLQTILYNDPINKYRCIHPKDIFEYKNHVCISMNLLDLSIFDFLKSNNFAPFPNSQIQSIAHQVLTSIAYIHDLKLVHTDLKPENILLRSSTYQTFTYNRKIPSSSLSTCRCATQRKVLISTDVYVIDFGSATFQDEYHSSVVSTRHYRAPEIILGIGWSYPCDIWSIACVLVELFTGDALFQTHDNREHLAMMEAVCGYRIDKDLVRRANAAHPDKSSSHSSRRYVNAMKKLSDFIPSTNDFLAKFLDLLQKMFVFDPQDRITARQALNHPWFRERSRDDGTEVRRLRAEGCFASERTSSSLRT